MSTVDQILALPYRDPVGQVRAGQAAQVVIGAVGRVQVDVAVGVGGDEVDQMAGASVLAYVDVWM